MIITLLVLPLIATALAEMSAKYQPDLIAIEILDATNSDQNVPFDCWIGAVESLELDTLTLPYVYDTNLSYGTNFCSLLAKNQQKALGIELTKCHMEDSGRSLLPKVCFTNGVSNGLNESGLKECLSTISEEAFIIYSQFFLHIEEACTKLTQLLIIHRKNEAITRFEESSKMLDEKIQQSILLQDTIIHSMTVQNEYLAQQHEDTAKAREEISHMIQSMVSQNVLLGEQKDILLSMNNVSSMTVSVLSFSSFLS